MRIAELEFDDYNEQELAAHSVSLVEVMQMLSNRYTVRRNKRAAGGTRQLIGETDGGRVLTVILVETAVDGRWRPITGWESTQDEKGALR